MNAGPKQQAKREKPLGKAPGCKGKLRMQSRVILPKCEPKPEFRGSESRH
jgi:hypothetical protein